MEEREAPDADAVVGDHDNRTLIEVGGDVIEMAEDDRRLVGRSGQVACPEQDHRWRRAPYQREQRAEIGVARHDHPILFVGEGEEFIVLGAFETEFEYVNGVMAGVGEESSELRRSILVDEESHAVGASGISRSATASAANRNAAATSSRSRGGSSVTTSSGVMPLAIIPTTVATGIRKPRMHGTPPICFALIVIRSTPTAYSPPSGDGIDGGLILDMHLYARSAVGERELLDEVSPTPVAPYVKLVTPDLALCADAYRREPWRTTAYGASGRGLKPPLARGNTPV